MENKLEQLLEKLLKLGWKPNGKEYNHIHSEANSIMQDFGTFYRFCNYVENGSINRALNLKLREIVSINSGLWQFVCENGMVALKLSARMKNPRIDWEDVDDYNNGHIVMNYKQKCEGDKAGYRLIESALKDESELEDFLLSNIKVDVESK